MTDSASGINVVKHFQLFSIRAPRPLRGSDIRATYGGFITNTKIIDFSITDYTDALLRAGTTGSGFRRFLGACRFATKPPCIPDFPIRGEMRQRIKPIQDYRSESAHLY